MLRIETKEVKHIIEYMGAKFTVVPMEKEARQEIIIKNTYPHKIKTGRVQKDIWEERIDFTELLKQSLDAQIVEWEGIEDGLDCNSENKRALASRKENEHICTFLQEAIDKIGNEEERAKKEIEEKEKKTSQAI